MTQHDELETQVEDGGEIICLFGIDGSVGMHFAKLALLAGYHIQALSPSPIDIQHDNLTLWEGDVTATDVILEEMLKGATYVVCLLSSSVSRKDYAEGTLLDFVKRLYPKMIESPVRLFLYQVSVGIMLQYELQVFLSFQY
jgi:nucleoside-diphosphate-sugar epimerase